MILLPVRAVVYRSISFFHAEATTSTACSELTLKLAVFHLNFFCSNSNTPVFFFSFEFETSCCKHLRDGLLSLLWLIQRSGILIGDGCAAERRTLVTRVCLQGKCTCTFLKLITHVLSTRDRPSAAGFVLLRPNLHCHVRVESTRSR